MANKINRADNFSWNSIGLEQDEYENSQILKRWKKTRESAKGLYVFLLSLNIHLIVLIADSII